MRISRRELFQGIGVTFGAWGVRTLGYNRLIPFVHQPDEVVPGVSTWYATSCRECPAGCGMVLRSRESRVVKCEGNPHHPVNRGRLCSRGQAALHGLYDPDRIRHPLRKNDSGHWEDATWEDILPAVAKRLKGKRIALISDLQTGSLDALMRSWLKQFGSDRMLTYEPINYENVKAAYGGVVPSFNIAKCDYLISFGADFLETWISPVEYAAQFAQMRQVKNGKRGKFVYIGPRMSMTAMNADERIIVPPGAEAEVAGRMAAEMSSPSSLVLVGESMLASVSAIKPSVNGLVDRGRPHAVTRVGTSEDAASLIADMEAGKIDALVIYGANPVYSLPQFRDALKRVKMVICLSSYMDETTALANWVLPSNTPLESWGDYSPYPDVTNLMQPTMGPLFDTKQTGDILIELARAAGKDTKAAFKANDFYGYLRQRWGVPLPPDDDGQISSPAWESALQIGGSWPGANEAATPVNGYQTIGWAVTPSAAAVKAPAPAPFAPTASKPAPSTPANGFYLHAYPHLHLYDGRGANRQWLQEMPEPVTKGVWGTWAELNPDTAGKLRIKTNDIVEISSGDTKIRVPAYVWKGVAPETIAIPIGQGHWEYGRFAKDTGANVWPLLTASGSDTIDIRNTGETKWMTRIRGSMEQHDREILLTTPLDEPDRREKEIIMPLPSGYKRGDFYPPHEDKPHRWAMVVDLDRCIGCQACVTACYAENNLAVVGADGIYRQREMPWIRIDRYLQKDRASMLFQPMLCQQCDAAPCEPVCPMYAAAHSEEGLNMQIYNRCIGTRYCSHNCPYKVRRFNWYDYKWPEPMNMQLNPDVTVRQRGVMEKCTFCIQRIREAEIVAKREGRQVKDGEIVPACAQTCPTKVFTFGNLKDPKSEVSRLFDKDPRAYQVLGELNTKPAVLYLKKRIG